MTIADRNAPSVLDSIDALRGYAILLVLLLHSPDWVSPTPGLLAAVVAEGGRGVQLFFIVSAFTLTRSLLFHRARGTRHIYTAYALRRFFRIAPMYYIILAVNLMPLGIAQTPTVELELWHIASVFVFLNAWVPHAINSVIEGGWSVAIEVNFYLLLPFILMMTTDLRKAFRICIGVGLIGYALSMVMYAYFLPGMKNNAHMNNEDVLLFNFFFFWLPCQFSAFGAGIILYFMPRLNLIDHPFVAPSLLVLCCGLVFFKSSPFLIQVYALAGFAYILIHKQYGLLCSAPLCFIGKISYSLYFLHFFVLRLAAPYVQPYLPMIENQTLRFWASWLLLLAITSAVATLTWLFIERPFIRLGGKVVARLERQPA